MNFFVANIIYLRKKAGENQAETASLLDFPRTTWASYEQGKASPDIDGILKIATHFNVSADELLGVDLSIPNLTDESRTQQKGKKPNLIPNPKPNLKGQNEPKTYPLNTDKNQQKTAEININYGARTPSILVVDQAGLDNIIYVPVKARAGYLLGYSDPEFMETLPTFRLPGLSNRDYRMFEIEGPSMAPNIMSGDRLIGEWVESLDQIRENRVHIVVTKDGILVKRVLNRIKERGKIYLKSDTIHHRGEYPTIELDPSDIRELWYGRLKLSGDLSEPSEIYSRVSDLEIKYLEIQKLLMPGKE